MEVAQRQQSTEHNKIHEVAGHRFKAKLLRQPSFCAHCKEFIFGLGKQGYKCQECDTVVHKRCHSKLTCNCTINQNLDPSTEDAERRNSITKSHNFNEHFFKKPTWCDHCGTMLYGISNQGVRCADCHTNVHHRCQQKAFNNCGNQR